MITEIFKACFVGPLPYKIFSGLLLILAIVWITWGIKITEKKDNNSEQQIKTIQETTQKAANTVESNKDLLLQLLQKTEKINHKSLKEKYPLGYCLFAIDEKQIIIPYNSRLESDFEIDWSKAKVEEITTEIVSITLPDIHDKIRHNRIISCSAGNVRRVGSITKAFNIGGLQIITEIVADNESGIIIALGFK